MSDHTGVVCQTIQGVVSHGGKVVALCSLVLERDVEPRRLIHSDNFIGHNPTPSWEQPHAILGTTPRHPGNNPMPSWEQPHAILGTTPCHPGNNPMPSWEQPHAILGTTPRHCDADTREYLIVPLIDYPYNKDWVTPRC